MGIIRDDNCISGRQQGCDDERPDRDQPERKTAENPIEGFKVVEV